VRHIKYFPAELEAVTLHRQQPALGQRHIETCKSISSDGVARPASTRERMNVVVSERGGRIREDADRAIRLTKMTRSRLDNHLGDALLIPVRWPEVAIVYGEGEAAGEAG